MTLKKLLGKLHLWLGLSSGLVVFIVSITGCIFVFEDEMYDLFHWDLVYVAVPDSKALLPVSRLKTIAQQAFGKEATINSVNIYAEPDKAYVFEVFKNDVKKTEESFWDNAGLNWKRIYVNPYTGKVNGIFDMQYEFFITVRAIHQNLYINSRIGSPIVGSATIIFLLLLVSGLVLWWPKNKAAARQRFRFKWKDTTQWKRKNYDLHNILGFYILLLGMFIGLTGIVWSFTWWENVVYRMLDGRIVKFTLPPNPNPEADAPKDIFDQVFRKVRAQNPAFLRIYLSENKDNNTFTAAVNFAGKDLWTAYNYYQYNLSTGLEYGNLLHVNKTVGQKWRNSNYDLHTGKTLGYPGMVLAFLTSLISASLPVTGLYIWWGRRGKSSSLNKGSKKRRSVLVSVPRKKYL